jgi:hypothetical protein
MIGKDTKAMLIRIRTRLVDSKKNIQPSCNVAATIFALASSVRMTDLTRNTCSDI